MPAEDLLKKGRRNLMMLFVGLVRLHCNGTSVHFSNKPVKGRALLPAMTLVFFLQAFSFLPADTEPNQSIRQPSGFGQINQ
jgi:hypothetical protein